MKSLLIAGLATFALTTGGLAQDDPEDFEFSAALQDQVETFREDAAALRGDIQAQMAGLETREEKQAVLEENAAALEALREERAQIADAARAELDAAGVEAPGGGEGGFGGRGGGGGFGGGGPGGGGPGPGKR